MTVTAAPVRLASDKQRNLIAALLTERVIPAPAAEGARVLLARADFPFAAASSIISDFLRAPRVPRVAAARPAAPVVRGWDEVNAALIDLPVGFYAIKVNDFTPALIASLAAPQPMLFVNVREFRGRKMLKKLTGNVGGFSRHTLTPAANMAVIRELTVDPVAAMTVFAEHYTVCGRCAAELTDEVSQRVRFGPTCRAVLGIEV